ncbi:MAG TPA: hypothetical protein VHN36_08840 [Ilumatobacteraceae bacterium]|nr:hypothetical protein [Ilumatobacteraceae bacterium]
MAEHDQVQRAQSAFEELHKAMLGVVDTFEHDAVVASNVAQQLGRDTPIAPLVENFDVSSARHRLTAALDAFETKRRNARVALWRVMIDEGCSIGEVSRIFGLSRQLVSRQLHSNE